MRQIKHIGRLRELDVKEICCSIGCCDGVYPRCRARRTIGRKSTGIYVCVINVGQFKRVRCLVFYLVIFAV